MIKVHVKIKNVYGVEKIYPDCPISEIFAALTKSKTLSENDIDNIIKLGYGVYVKPIFITGKKYESISLSDR